MVNCGLIASMSAEPANPLLEKFNELTTAVEEKPEDFSSWTSLLSTAEKLVRFIRAFTNNLAVCSCRLLCVVSLRHPLFSTNRAPDHLRAAA